MNKKTKKQLFWVSIIFFIFAAPAIILYTNGWRITSDFSFKRTGGIFVSADATGAEIFLNGKLEKRTNLLQDGVFIQGLIPRTMSVLIAKEDYWPWSKDLNVKESLVTEARAFLVPKNIKGTSLLRANFVSLHRVAKGSIVMLERAKQGYSYEFYFPKEKSFFSVRSGASLLSSRNAFTTFFEKEDSLYLVFPEKTIRVTFDLANVMADAAISRAPEFSKTPTLPHKIIVDSRERSRVWISEDSHSISAQWLASSPFPYYFNDTQMKIFESSELIKSIDFFPSRRDVVIFAIKNGIFAIELDGRSTRNFQPIYQGKNPMFVREGNLLYILDDGILLEATL